MSSLLTKEVAVLGFKSLAAWKVGLASVGTFALAYGAYSRMTRPKYNSSSTSDFVMKGINLKGKIIIVTGANTGIGKETVRSLVKSGGTVIMGCRSKERASKAKEDIINTFSEEEQKTIEDNLDIILIDLNNLESVKKFAVEFTKKYNALHFLVNNAGVNAVKFETTKDGFEFDFGVNHIGHSYLTLLLTPLMIKSKPSRVIMLTSSGHKCSPKPIYEYLNKLKESKIKSVLPKEGHNVMKYYGISKSLNILFAKEYNNRYSKLGVKAVSVHPGNIPGTELGRNFSLKVIVRGVYDLIDTHLFDLFAFKSLKQGAATTLRCIVLSEEEFSKSEGHYFADCNDCENSTLRSDHRNSKELNECIKQFFDYTKKLIENKGFNFELN